MLSVVNRLPGVRVIEDATLLMSRQQGDTYWWWSRSLSSLHTTALSPSVFVIVCVNGYLFAVLQYTVGDILVLPYPIFLFLSLILR